MNKKINLILDIDETIVKTIVPSHNNLNLLDKEGVKQISIFNKKYLVFFRPNLENFIDFCFNNFNIGFWTAGSSIYCNIILKIILSDEQYKNCSIIFARDDNNYVNLKTNKVYSNVTDKNSIRKPLSLLWSEEVFKEIFNKENTIIIDDNPNIKIDNPNNSILIKEFKKESNDNVLEKLIVFLTDILKNDKVGKLDFS
tara:strand:- start:2335 stop:2928 length:594 start_codon:yes stop_codon:yes gene_type:complete